MKLYDEHLLEHKSFVRISKAFLLVQCINIHNEEVQNCKQNQQTNDHTDKI